MPEPKRPLKVFLCHAHADRDPVRGLYTRLTQDGVDAWLDKAKLLPGQDWELEIRKAVREADVVVVCLSNQFNQRGFRQKEVRLALDTAMEIPEGEIFIIPARLEECDNLESLRKWHEVDLFEDNGYEILMRGLRARADQIGVEINTEKLEDIQEALSSFDTVVDGVNWEYVTASEIFNYRLSDAFPGLRGVEKFSGSEAVHRLEVLLRYPMSVKGGQNPPFYWFRGIANNHIFKFERLDTDRILLDIVEMKIDYIVAVRKFPPRRNFVYVHLLPEEPTGLYKYTDEWLQNYVKAQFKKKSGGYFCEEYGVFGDKLVTRAEYDDGATIVNGKVVQMQNVDLRVRYITPFNFILFGVDHVLNMGFVDWECTELFDEILLNNKNVDDLISFVESIKGRPISQ